MEVKKVYQAWLFQETFVTKVQETLNQLQIDQYKPSEALDLGILCLNQSVSLFMHPDQAQNTSSGKQGQEATAVAVIYVTAPP